MSLLNKKIEELLIDHGFVDTMAKRLAEPLILLHKALCSADEYHLKLIKDHDLLSTTLGAATFVGRNTSSRHEFDV